MDSLLDGWVDRLCKEIKVRMNRVKGGLLIELLINGRMVVKIMDILLDRWMSRYRDDSRLLHV